MGQRLDLQTLLLGICPNVYFQPPESIHLIFPCIVYNRDWGFTSYADDRPYRHVLRYQVTVIDRNPDSELIKPVAALSMCVYDRFFANDDLNHDVFKIFF